MNKICLILVLFFWVTACTQSSNSAKVTGEVVISANETSFQHAVVYVSLYEYHPYLADVNATLKDSKKILEVAHQKGTETRVPFVVGEQESLVSEMEYYVTLSIYQHNAVASEYCIFYGKPKGQEIASVFGKHPNTVVFEAQKQRDYTEGEQPQYPQSFWCQIPELSHPEMIATLRARMIVKHGNYLIDRHNLLSSGEYVSSGDFEAVLEKLQKDPMPPFPTVPEEIQMVIEIENVSKKEISFTSGGDQGSLEMRIEGPGYYRVPTATVFSEENRPGTKITLKAGEKHELPVTMCNGYRNSVNHYLTRSGYYRMNCSLKGKCQVKEWDGSEILITIESPEIVLIAKEEKF